MYNTPIKLNMLIMHTNGNDMVIYVRIWQQLELCMCVSGSLAFGVHY